MTGRPRRSLGDLYEGRCGVPGAGRLQGPDYVRGLAGEPSQSGTGARRRDFRTVPGYRRDPAAAHDYHTGEELPGDSLTGIPVPAAPWWFDNPALFNCRVSYGLDYKVTCARRDLDQPSDRPPDH